MSDKEIIIIPAYNEERYIGKVIDKIKSLYESIDILIINDGSTDNTSSIAKDKGAIVIDLPYNLGYGIALQTGFKYANKYEYKYVITMDADGQHEPACIADLLLEIKKSEVNLVIGSRFLKNEKFKMPILKRIGLYIFRSAVKFHTDHKITDPTSGFQAINNKLLKFFISHFYPSDYPDADLLIMIHRAGFKFKEIPVVMYPSPPKKGMHYGFKSFYYVFKMVISILAILLRSKRAYSAISENNLQ